MHFASRTSTFLHKAIQLQPSLVRPHTRSAATMSNMKPLTLLTSGTPNGWKPAIMLEELALPYVVKSISLSNSEQKEASYLAINPNGRIPAMVDPNKSDLAIFESGSILWYLAVNYDTEHKLWPKDIAGQTETMNWLMFQMGGVGPMQGQANHFVRYASERVEYGINRYSNETRRLYKVMDDHLAGKKWLAAGQFTIADIATFSWVFTAPWADIKTDDLPNLTAWVKRISDRPAVQRGLNVPEENKILKIVNDPELMKIKIAEAQAMMGSAKKA